MAFSLCNLERVFVFEISFFYCHRVMSDDDEARIWIIPQPQRLQPSSMAHSDHDPLRCVHGTRTRAGYLILMMLNTVRRNTPQRLMQTFCMVCALWLSRGTPEMTQLERSISRPCPFLEPFAFFAFSLSALRCHYILLLLLLWSGCFSLHAPACSQS